MAHSAIPHGPPARWQVIAATINPLIAPPIELVPMHPTWWVQVRRAFLAYMAACSDRDDEGPVSAGAGWVEGVDWVARARIILEYTRCSTRFASES